MYLNKQKYSECLLVTALNAAVFLGFPPILPDTEEYERLVDLVFARNGSAIRIDRAYDYLKLCKQNMEPTWEDIIGKINLGHPVEVSIWHKKTGYHSVLIVNYLADKQDRKTTKYIQVLNFKQITDDRCYVEWNKFKKYIRKSTACCVELNSCEDNACWFFYINPVFQNGRFISIST